MPISFRQSRLSPFFFVVVFLSVSTGFGQFRFESDETSGESQYGPRPGESLRQTWLAGIEIYPGPQMDNLRITMPVPMVWPEQKITAVKEKKLDGGAKVAYRTIDNGVREMILTFNRYNAAVKTEVIVAFELENYEILPPEQTDVYVIPKKPPSGVSAYLKPSPKIESNDRKFLAMFKEITHGKETDWDKVEAIYRYVQDHVTYNDINRAGDANGALAVISLQEGKWEGDCKDMCCLFIAICRAGKIPARMVRVPEHCYAEFYLELPPEIIRTRKAKDPTGFWFPCQVAGTYSFGGVPEQRPILQKGDSCPDYDDKRGRDKVLFLKNTFEGLPTGPSGGTPKFKHLGQTEIK